MSGILATGAGARQGQSSPDIHHESPATLVHVRHLLDTIRIAFTDAHMSAALSENAQIVLGEVLNNIVEHAYGFKEDGTLEISIWLSTASFFCEICDFGAPMPMGAVPTGIMPFVDGASQETLPEGGFGWAMCRRLACDIRYSRDDGMNRLSFTVYGAANGQAESAEA